MYPCDNRVPPLATGAETLWREARKGRTYCTIPTQKHASAIHISQNRRKLLP